MSVLALCPACQFMTGYVCASYCPWPVSDALHHAACAAGKWLRPAAACRSCQCPPTSAGPAPTSSHCTARSTRRSSGQSTSRWPWPTRVRLLCPSAPHISCGAGPVLQMQSIGEVLQYQTLQLPRVLSLSPQPDNLSEPCGFLRPMWDNRCSTSLCRSPQGCCHIAAMSCHMASRQGFTAGNGRSCCVAASMSTCLHEHWTCRP